MASAPLIDFERLDLSRVVVPVEEIRKFCRQRNRFEMLDGLLHFDPEHDEVAVGFKDIRASDWWAADHIPGRPIFPGALIIEGAAQLSSFDYLQRQVAMREHFVGFGGLEHTRFRGLVVPDCRLVWAAKAMRMRSSMFTYAAQGFVERKLVFEAEIIGVVL